MMVNRDLVSVRDRLDTIVGQKIKLTSNRGHKKMTTKQGVLEKTYPGIFVVKLDNTKGVMGRRISFSYADVLTKAIELSIVEEA